MTKVIGESKNTAARWHLLTGAVVFCALMVAGLGGMTLVGWLAEIDDLASFGTDKIPMAPSTALFFLLYGVMILLQVSPPAADRRRVLMSLPALPVTAVAVALLISSSLDRHFTIEHLGLDITGTLNGMPLGHMSPLTAFSFLLAGAALLSLVVGRAGRRLLPFLVAFALASLLSLLGLALLLAYLLGSPIFYGSGLIPPALPTALAFFLLAFCLQGLALPGLWQFALWSRFHPSYYALLLIFVILIGGIMVVGFVSFRHEEQEHRSAMSRQLTAVADLKTEMIAAWLRERDSHGWELMSNQGFAERVEQWLRHDSAVDRHIIMTRLESHFANYDYDGIVLYDPELRRQYGLGDCQELDPVMVATIEQAAQSRQVERSDLYRCPAGFVRMHWVVPILDLADGRLLAFVVRHVQVQSFLQPLLAGWAGSGRSSETLLVRREGEAVMFLGGRWLAEEQFLALRLGLDRTEVPAVQAVLGHEGLTEGRDYRGVPVMAAVKPVPGSSWYLVARIDLAEVYGPLGGILWAIVVLVLFLLLGAAGGIFLLWRRQLSVHGFALLALAAARDQQIKGELEARVAQRTAQLETLNRELESFSYSISHDLKAPLRGVQGYSRLLARDYRDRLDEDGRLFVAYIAKGVAEMQQLVDGLLAYSRMERRQEQPRPVNLADLVRDVLAGFGEELATHGVELAVEVPEELITVDPEGLSMVLRNLVDNAVKFSQGSRPPRLFIGAEISSQRLLLKVRDNGIGFDMKFGERIFEIFSRLDNARQVAGTGVGLAMVRRAVQRLGGRLEVASAPGDGTVFELEIPLPAVDDKKTGTERGGNEH